ncbi:hypothetical protein CDL15_Pgr016884 [Punica granatum]|uniref:Uncharacterized protein n=1 Tax=Punica granatum TaxID=22663 RepID=A0A218WXH3_PUNGR|nr:hypothetical protein CDL15_Pgr016884 [Punica granatum]
MVYVVEPSLIDCGWPRPAALICSVPPHSSGGSIGARAVHSSDTNQLLHLSRR